MAKSINPRSFRPSQARTAPPPLDVLTTPAIFPSGAFKLDHAVALEAKALLAGWCSSGLVLDVFALKKLATFAKRQDEFQSDVTVVGFLAVVEIDGDTDSISIAIADAEVRRVSAVRLARSRAAIDLALTDYAAQLAPVLGVLTDSPGWATLLLAHAGRHPLGGSCKGYIEASQAVPGCGGLAVGWALAKDDAELWLAPADGCWRSLAEAVRFDRPDIHEAFDSEYGHLAVNAGFLCALYGACALMTPVSLVSVGSSGLALVAQKEWTAAPTSPMHYAKWAFSLPTPTSRFCERMARHDGRLLEKLIARGAPSLDTRCEETVIGRPAAAPWASVIVSLSGFPDFMEHQLLEFSSDADFLAGDIDLVYVIDDPALLEKVRERAQALFRLYRVSFRLLWGGRRRGLSGANNLGAAKAHAEHLIFLDSESIPLEPGWARYMVDVLRARGDIAAAGARLLYPDGSLYHLGMQPEHDPCYGVWVNRNPGQGLMQSGSGDALVEVKATSGACLAVRRRDFEAVDGFDEGYLHCFQDSDLCFKLGGKIVVLANTSIVYLERGPSGPRGEHEVQEKQILFDAWRHSERWWKMLHCPVRT